jgi:VWFA-related protein
MTRSLNRRSAWRVVPSAAVAAAVIAGVGAHPFAGQEPQAGDQRPSFRTRADLIQLDVSVLDEHGNPIRGLTADDFTILDRGVPRPVAGFAAVDLPDWPADAAPWIREIGPDVVANHPDARRAVVIVMDDFATPWDPGVSKLARSIAHSAIDGLGAADLAAVVYVVRRKNGQEFTSDRARLRAAVDRFTPSGLHDTEVSPFSASLPGRGLQQPGLLPLPSGACPKGCVMDALRNAADILGSWPDARKTMVLISPGRLVTQLDSLDSLSEREDLGRTLAALQEANVNVYQFDPRGLEVSGEIHDEFGVFADATGGRAIENTNDPGALVPQMFRENSSYYLLGFEPAEGSRDGRFHRLRVTVDRPGAVVRTRTGYYAASEKTAAREKEDKTSDLDTALSGGLPGGDLPLSLATIPVAIDRKPGAAVAVVTRLDGQVAPGTTVELVAAAFDDTWKEVARVTERFLLPEGHTLGSPEVGTGLNLGPGRYEVRVAMTRGDRDGAGSVFASVTVPDYAREALSLSGVVIEAAAAGAVMPSPLAAQLPARPTARRTFSPGETVAASLRVYQKRAKTIAPARVLTRIVDAQGREVFAAERVLEPSLFEDRRQADYRVELPLDRLEPGEHLLTVEATAGESTARREVRFTVRRPPAVP